MGRVLSKQVAQAKSRPTTKAETDLKYVVQFFPQGEVLVIVAAVSMVLAESNTHEM